MLLTLISALGNSSTTFYQQRIKGVETTATFDEAKDEFVFDSPTPSSAKNWISQGLYAEEAVILAELVVKGEKKGPHLFWGRIARPPARAARPAPLLAARRRSNKH